MTDKNRYKMLALLGQGAMGTVYKAIDKQIDREVAIKILHPHLLAGEMGEELTQRFKHEVKAAARCQHPNIVTVYDYGFNKGSPYMVMEYVKGVDLQVFLKAGQVLNTEQAIKLILKVLDALSVAHAMGVVHRDIKPANIMLLENGQIKVMDFGVARIDTSDLTQLGDVMGTPCYMSPEARSGEATDSLSDLYTTALVLLELLIQKRLKIETINDVSLTAELEKKGLAPQLVASLAVVLSKALQKHPQLRYQDAFKFSKALADCLQTAPNDCPVLDDLGATVLQVQTKPQGHQSSPDNNTESMLSNDSVLLQSQLTQIEKSLTSYLGPVAKVMVKKHAQQSANFGQLLDTLGNFIAADVDRQKFMASLQSSGIRKGAGDSSTRTAANRVAVAEKSDISAEYLQQLTADLVVYLGPMTSHLVKAAQKKTGSKKNLCALLAEKIPNTDERARFLTAWARK